MENWRRLLGFAACRYCDAVKMANEMIIGVKIK
jgi:hypothetical protein